MSPEQLTLDQAPKQRPVSDAIASALNDTSPTPVHAEDPPTAWRASVAAGLRAPSMRRRVLLVLVAAGERGCTDFELSERLGILRTSAGKRRVELQRLGLVVITGVRRPTDTTTPASVWRASEDGKAVAEQLAREAG